MRDIKLTMSDRGFIEDLKDQTGVAVTKLEIILLILKSRGKYVDKQIPAAPKDSDWRVQMSFLTKIRRKCEWIDYEEAVEEVILALEEEGYVEIERDT